MSPGDPLPTKLNSEIGYALYHLTGPDAQRMSGPEILDRLEARGHVRDRAQAREILAQARRNIAATQRAQAATTGQSLRAACDYKCDADTQIGVRIMVTAVRPDGTTVDNISIVVRASAGENLGDVLHRARAIFNRLYRRGTAHRSGQMRMVSDPQPEDISQILLNYTEGRLS